VSEHGPTFRQAFVVDRSASMAWSYADSGLLGVVLLALQDAAGEAIGSDLDTLWFTFGSPLELEWLSRHDASAELSAVEALRPALFSSGAVLPWSRLSEIQADWIVCITDAPPLPEKGQGVVDTKVHVVHVGMDADALIPQEQLLAQESLRAAGIPFMGVGMSQSPQEVRTRVMRWALDQLRKLAIASEVR
jgi:hypothetical protein